jgi:hypothetical protein
VSTPATLVVSGQVVMQECLLYRHMCAVVDDHHICPKSWFEHAGVPVTTPMIKICPSCHMDTHAAIDGMILGHDVSRLPRRCVALARQALTIAHMLELTPTRTL